MKSAYELAMERLEKKSPTVKLTEEQRRELAELDSRYQAKLAEREVFLRSRLAAAQTQGRLGEVDELQLELSRELARIRADWEEKKEAVRQR